MEGTSPGPGDVGVLNQIASPNPTPAPISPSSAVAGHVGSRDGKRMGDGIGPEPETNLSSASRWRHDANSLDMRVAAKEHEARVRVEMLIMARDARRNQMERSHNEARMLYSEAVEKGRVLTSRARITPAPARNDKLLVVTSLEGDGHRWKQTTYYPTKRYHIDNVTYSRSQRRRDAIPGRTPASRGFTVRSNVSAASRSTHGGAEVNFLAVSTPLNRSRRSTLYSRENDGRVPSQGSMGLFPDRGADRRGSWDAGPSPLVQTANTYGKGMAAYAHRGGDADDADSRVSTSRRPPRGTEQPLIFPRHRPGAMPTHSNPLLAAKLRVKEVASLSSPRKRGEVMMHWDGSQTERAREKPGWKGAGVGQLGSSGNRTGGHDGGAASISMGVDGHGNARHMAAWVKVADVVPISPRRRVAGYVCNPSITLKRPAGDPEYIPVVSMGEEPGSSGFRLRHMGPCKGGVVLNEVHTEVKERDWGGQMTYEGSSARDADGKWQVGVSSVNVLGVGGEKQSLRGEGRLEGEGGEGSGLANPDGFDLFGGQEPPGKHGEDKVAEGAAVGGGRGGDRSRGRFDTRIKTGETRSSDEGSGRF